MRIRFWKRWGQGEDDLVRDADWQATQAAHALRDGAMDHAIRWSDRTVTNTRKVLARWRKKGRADQRVIEIFADRLWDRALIHKGLGNVGEAIRDATEALAIFEEMQQVHGVKHLLRVPSGRLLLSELYAQAGDVAAARHHAQAIEAYENVIDGDSLVLANGYDHYGRAMRLIGDPAAAPALRRAVDLYRQDDMLNDGRRIIQRFVETAILAADAAKPVTAAAAPEILSMLRDAATWVSRLPPVPGPRIPLLPPPEYYADLYTMTIVQERMAEWLEALDAPQIEDLYGRRCG